MHGEWVLAVAGQGHFSPRQCQAWQSSGRSLHPGNRELGRSAASWKSRRSIQSPLHPAQPRPARRHQALSLSLLFFEGGRWSFFKLCTKERLAAPQLPSVQPSSRATKKEAESAKRPTSGQEQLPVNCRASQHALANLQRKAETDSTRRSQHQPCLDPARSSC